MNRYNIINTLLLAGLGLVLGLLGVNYADTPWGFFGVLAIACASNVLGFLEGSRT